MISSNILYQKCAIFSISNKWTYLFTLTLSYFCDFKLVLYWYLSVILGVLPTLHQKIRLNHHILHCLFQFQMPHVVQVPFEAVFVVSECKVKLLFLNHQICNEVNRWKTFFSNKWHFLVVTNNLQDVLISLLHFMYCFNVHIINLMFIHLIHLWGGSWWYLNLSICKTLDEI